MSVAQLRTARIFVRVLLVIAIVLAFIVLYLMAIKNTAGAAVVTTETKTVEVLVSDRTYVDAVVTAYCACERCCEADADGRTAWWRGVSKGYASQPGCAVAPDAIPYGTWLHIPGAGWRQADDRGGAMVQAWKRNRTYHVDLRFNTHREALAWGVQHLRVEVHQD